MVLLHALLEKEPYVPKTPRPVLAVAPAMFADPSDPESPPIPVNPMSTNVEAKIRRKVRGFKR